MKDIVILKPDWLAVAISYVLDDKSTREGNGLVQHSRLSELWNDKARPPESNYPSVVHPLFCKLMERFDIAYPVAAVPQERDGDATLLIGQLVPDARPDISHVWPTSIADGSTQQVQICRIVGDNGQMAAAEGLFYQLIVRLHRYSLGRINFCRSVQWKRGLILEDEYGSRALLEHVGNDVRITVRSPYPEGFLGLLTHEVKWLVENFWRGLKCLVMVPCNAPCSGLHDVEMLLETLKEGIPKVRCQCCKMFPEIKQLLHNAVDDRPRPEDALREHFEDVKKALEQFARDMRRQHAESLGRFDHLDEVTRRILSQIDAAYLSLLQIMTDEAKDGPRLFSFEPVPGTVLGLDKWAAKKYRLTLWCEHCRLPLPVINGLDDSQGMYTINIPRDWLIGSAPYLRKMASTLSLVLPVAAAAASLRLEKHTLERIEKQLAFAKASAESLLKLSEMGLAKAVTNEDEYAIAGSSGLSKKAHFASNGSLRLLHAWLKEKDPSFGGLVRVQNKRQEFMWVHPRFVSQY